MTAPQVRSVMIGGFLGAGKTTSVLRFGRWLTDRGLRVGLVTNDQGGGLVDTALAGALVAEMPPGAAEPSRCSRGTPRTSHRVRERGRRLRRSSARGGVCAGRANPDVELNGGAAAGSRPPRGDSDVEPTGAASAGRPAFVLAACGTQPCPPTPPASLLP